MTLPEESLQQNGLTSNEWDELNHIAEISEILRAYRRICRWLRTNQRFHGEDHYG